MQTASLVLASADNSSIAAVIVDLVATAVIFVALIRIVATPRERWAHGRLSKTAWIIASIWFTPYLGAIVVPIGALVAIWKTDSLSRATKPENFDVPFAEGKPSPEAAADEYDR